MSKIIEIRVRLQTEDNLYLYEFGTHVKHIGKARNIKVSLSEKEILEIKQKVKDELQKIIGSLGEEL